MIINTQVAILTQFTLYQYWKTLVAQTRKSVNLQKIKSSSETHSNSKIDWGQSISWGRMWSVFLYFWMEKLKISTFITQPLKIWQKQSQKWFSGQNKPQSPTGTTLITLLVQKIHGFRQSWSIVGGIIYSLSPILDTVCIYILNSFYKFQNTT